MVLPRPATFRTFTASQFGRPARAFRSSSFQQWQRNAQRTSRHGYATSSSPSGHSSKQSSSDLPWLIGALVVTVPSCAYILTPSKKGHEALHGESHAKGGGDASIVPQKIQEALPEGIERAVPNFIHDTGDDESDGESHAKGGGEESVVPQKVQEALPEGVERAVPNAIHDTGDGSEGKSHAKGEGEESVVPQKLQEALPEGVERAVPNALHDTGDESGDQSQDKSSEQPGQDDKSTSDSKDKPKVSPTEGKVVNFSDDNTLKKESNEPITDDDRTKDQEQIVHSPDSAGNVDGVQFKGATKQGGENKAMSDTRKHVPDAKGGYKKRIESGYGMAIGSGPEDRGGAPGKNDDRAISGKMGGDQNSMSGKQKGFSNTVTKHSSDIASDPGKSKKGEGTAETAKLSGTVSVNRPPPENAEARDVENA